MSTPLDRCRMCQKPINNKHGVCRDCRMKIGLKSPHAEHKKTREKKKGEK